MSAHDEDLRALLEDAVAGVDPASGLDAVRSRTAHLPRRRWVLPALGSGVLVAALVAAFFVLGPGTASGPSDPGQAAGPAQSGSSDWYMGWTDEPDDQDGATDDTVVVSSPADGATVTSPFTVTGTAVTFEGTVTWKLRPVGGGRVVDGFATAAECCTSSPYSFTVTAPTGHYTLVVSDQDVSDGEGTTTEVSQEVTVR